MLAETLVLVRCLGSNTAHDLQELWGGIFLLVLFGLLLLCCPACTGEEPSGCTSQVTARTQGSVVLARTPGGGCFLELEAQTRDGTEGKIVLRAEGSGVARWSQSLRRIDWPLRACVSTSGWAALLTEYPRLITLNDRGALLAKIDLHAHFKTPRLASFSSTHHGHELSSMYFVETDSTRAVVLWAYWGERLIVDSGTGEQLVDDGLGAQCLEHERAFARSVIEEASRERKRGGSTLSAYELQQLMLAVYMAGRLRLTEVTEEIVALQDLGWVCETEWSELGREAPSAWVLNPWSPSGCRFRQIVKLTLRRLGIQPSDVVATSFEVRGGPDQRPPGMTVGWSRRAAMIVRGMTPREVVEIAGFPEFVGLADHPEAWIYNLGSGRRGCSFAVSWGVEGVSEVHQLPALWEDGVTLDDSLAN